MANSTAKRPAKKPAKPHRDFPLFPHRNGQWAKKVKGKLCYFGTWADPDSALQKWVDQRDDLLAGRVPRIKGGELTVKEMCERFMAAKRIFVDAGELSVLTWSDYHTACRRIITAFGNNRPVPDLAADDFEALRASLGQSWSPVSIKVELQRIRSVFKYAYDSGLIDRPVRFGPTFKPPSARVILKDRQSKGPRMFEADQIRQMIDAAEPQLRAMILLGINCGYGNTDCSSLPKPALDLDNGWVEFPRPKTGIERRCKLWPETVEAIKVAMASRPAPKNPEDDNLVFVTVRGHRWVHLSGDRHVDCIVSVTTRLLQKLGLKKRWLGFYGLRHSHRTVADGVKDQPAANAIMGHTDDSMAAVYRERIDDSRLVAVADHVHAWLFADSE
jgi:integrase